MWSIQTITWGHYFKRRLVVVTSRRLAYLTKTSPLTSHFTCPILQSVRSFESPAVSSPYPSFSRSNTVQQLTVPALLCVLYSVSDDKNDKQGTVASSYAKPEPSRFFSCGARYRMSNIPSLQDDLV